MMNIVFIIVLYCVGVLVPTEGAKILAVFHIPMKSHHIIGSSLVKGLAAKGHQVTLASPFLADEKSIIPNYAEIYLDGVMEIGDDTKKALADWSDEDKLTLFIKHNNVTNMLTDATLRSNGMQQLLKSNEKFDLVIMELFGSEAFTGLGHYFNAPIIGVSPSVNQLVNPITGNVAPYSFVPNMLSTYSDRMAFIERVINTILGVLNHMHWNFFILPEQRKQYDLFFKDAPAFDEAIKNVSLCLVNSHIIFETPRPYLPNMIQIGGLQIEEPKKLPEDLQNFLDTAKGGAIYFSLGSNLKSAEEEKLTAIRNTFAKLPYKVLWKLEELNFSAKSSNLKTGKWFPQTDILAHPNIKLFITHGGLLSTTEAIHRGVPLLGIPFSSNQMANTAGFVKSGFGQRLLFQNLTEVSFTESIQEVLTNPMYRSMVKKSSIILQDQPMKPLDTAIFWVEYIIRHNGGLHLRAASLELTLIQYLLLDVIAFMTFVSGTFIVGIYLSCKTICCSRIKNESKGTTAQKKTKPKLT